MGNYNETKTEVLTYLRARTPLIIVNSYERNRVERMLAEVVEETGLPISYYTDGRQMRRLDAGGGANGAAQDVDGDPLPFIISGLRKSRRETFALGDVKRIGDENMYTVELLTALYLAKESEGTIMIVTPDIVWQRIAQFGMITTLSYPDLDERIERIEGFLAPYRSSYYIDWEGQDIVKAATLLRGFTEIQIDNILSSSLIAYGGLYREKIYELTSQKSRHYGSVSTITQVSGLERVNVAGLENLKQWLEYKKRVFFASNSELAARNLVTPKGILLAGIPGCGKSYSARMIAKNWELPLFRFDIGLVYDKWVGESEKRMKDALAFIDNVAPCVLWIDEIEKALSVSDTGNDTGKRVLSQFLFWLQESTSRVFLVATANDISALPPELFRKGRFSEMFFLDLPHGDERREALSSYIAGSLLFDMDEDDIEKLVDITEGFSYADIESAVKESAEDALAFGQGYINFERIVAKIQGIVPISVSNPELVERSREWGNERAVPASEKRDAAENETTPGGFE